MLGVLFIAMILPIHTLSYLAFLIKYFLFFIYSLLLFNEYIMYHSLAIYICLLTISLFQGLANYGPAFVNKVLLEHSHAHLFTYCLWLFLYYKRHIWEVLRETVWFAKPKIFLFCPLQKKFADPFLKLLSDYYFGYNN